MKTQQKLLLGSGLVIGLFVLLVGGLSLWLDGVDDRLTSIATRAQPANAAASEMEISALALGLATWRYLATGNPSARERIARDAAAFDQSKAAYDRLTTDSRSKALSQRVGVLFDEFRTLSGRLVADRDANRVSRDADLARFGELRNVIHDLLDNEIQKATGSELLAASDEVHRIVRAILWTSLALLAASAVIALVSSLAIGRGVVKTEETLRVTIASIGDAVITTDAEGRVATMNPVAQALTGWSEDAARGKKLPTVFAIVNEQTRSAAENPVEKVLAHGKVVGLANHTILLARDGRELPIDDSAASIRDADGRIVGVVLVFRDVTERRAAERKLTESEARKAAILETSLDCIVTIDHHGRILDFNPAAERTFGYKRDDVIGREMAEVIVPPGLREAHRRGLERYAKTGAGSVLGKRLELTAMHANGHEFPVELAITRISAAGAPVFTGYLRDITERKGMEDRLQQYVADLSEVDRRKNEFLATLSHELRNPLAPMRNAMEIVRMNSSDPSTVQSATQMMKRQLEQMVRLIDDLLDISRINRGKIELRREWFDAAAALRDAMHAARAMFDHAGIAFIGELPAQPLFIDADPARLVQIVGNLMNNAAKYSHSGGTVWLSAVQEGAALVIRVRDMGVGIAADELDRIFDMFAQADASTERARAGLGIGLTLARNLATLHDGTITATSDGPGRGSEFILRLPIGAERARRDGVRDEPSAPTAGMMRPHRILIVDDNRDAAESLALVLGTLGHDVHLAHDGTSALTAARELRPHAVLLDIGLPKLDGYEVCRRLRAEPWGRDLVIIAVSGWGAEEHVARAKAAGFDMHLVKPADPKQVIAVLRSHAPAADAASAS